MNIITNNAIISILLIKSKSAFNILVKITLKNIISVPTFLWKSMEETPNSLSGLLKFHFLFAYPRRMTAEWSFSKNSQEEIKNTAEGKTMQLFSWWLFLFAFISLIRNLLPSCITLLPKSLLRKCSYPLSRAGLLYQVGYFVIVWEKRVEQNVSGI